MITRLGVKNIKERRNNMPNMIEVNATSILVFLIYSGVIFGTGFILNGLLMMNKEPKSDKEDYSELICWKKCSKRVPLTDLLQRRLALIGQKEYLKVHNDHNNIPPERFDKGNNVDEEV
jgi:hypothetical protein